MVREKQKTKNKFQDKNSQRSNFTVEVQGTAGHGRGEALVAQSRVNAARWVVACAD